MLRGQRGRSRRRGRVDTHRAKRVPAAVARSGASGWRQNCRKEIYQGQCCPVRRASDPSAATPTGVHRPARTPSPRTTSLDTTQMSSSPGRTDISVDAEAMLDLSDLCILPLMTSARMGARRVSNACRRLRVAAGIDITPIRDFATRSKSRNSLRAPWSVSCVLECRDAAFTETSR